MLRVVRADQDLSKSPNITGLSRAMRYGIIDINGAVVNVIDYSEAPAQPPPGFGEGFIAVQSDDVGPGWTYIDGVLAAPPSPPPAPAAPVTSVTPRQARLALLNAGLLDQVQTAVEAGSVSDGRSLIRLLAMRQAPANRILLVKIVG